VQYIIGADFDTRFMFNGYFRSEHASHFLLRERYCENTLVNDRLILFAFSFTSTQQHNNASMNAMIDDECDDDLFLV
jgi:hypothetical protein